MDCRRSDSKGWPEKPRFRPGGDVPQSSKGRHAPERTVDVGRPQSHAVMKLNQKLCDSAVELANLDKPCRQNRLLAIGRRGLRRLHHISQPTLGANDEHDWNASNLNILGVNGNLRLRAARQADSLVL